MEEQTASAANAKVDPELFRFYELALDRILWDDIVRWNRRIRDFRQQNIRRDVNDTYPYADFILKMDFRRELLNKLDMDYVLLNGPHVGFKAMIEYLNIYINDNNRDTMWGLEAANLRVFLQEAMKETAIKYGIADII